MVCNFLIFCFSLIVSLRLASLSRAILIRARTKTVTHVVYRRLYSPTGFILQITQSKTGLEQALKLTKKLKKESASLRDFVTGVNKELSKREMPTAAKDIEDELVWAKVWKSFYQDMLQAFLMPIILFCVKICA